MILKRNEPTHSHENSSSCIDIIFTSQANLVIDAGLHPSLHVNSHHQILYAKFNSKIQCPPLYEREVWHFQKADINLIREAMNEFNWERAFSILISMRWYLLVMQLLRTLWRTSFRSYFLLV